MPLRMAGDGPSTSLILHMRDVFMDTNGHRRLEYYAFAVTRSFHRPTRALKNN